MSKTFAALTTAFILAAAPAALAAPKVGAAVPAFTATDSNGKTHQLSDFKGKTVVMEWTNDQCPFVQKHYDSGNMQATQKAAAEDGVVWLVVNSGAPGKQGHVSGAEANAIMEKAGAANTAYLIDASGDIGRAYAARTTPHMYIINPEGTLVYMGGIDDKPTADKADIEGATNYVTAALADMAADRPVQTATSKPYGCSVKY